MNGNNNTVFRSLMAQYNSSKKMSDKIKWHKFGTEVCRVFMNNPITESEVIKAFEDLENEVDRLKNRSLINRILNR